MPWIRGYRRASQLRHRPRHSTNEPARQRSAKQARPRVAADRRLLSGEARVELSRRQDAVIDQQSLKGGEPCLIVAGEVLRFGKALLRPPERIVADAEHRVGHEQAHEHARLPWVMEHGLVGLDRDRAEPLPHAAHVVQCAVHGAIN